MVFGCNSIRHAEANQILCLYKSLSSVASYRQCLVTGIWGFAFGLVIVFQWFRMFERARGFGLRLVSEFARNVEFALCTVGCPTQFLQFN